jgi:hypothetical protein
MLASTSHAAVTSPAKPRGSERIFVADGGAWLDEGHGAVRLSRPVKLTNGGQVLPTGEVDFPGGRRGLLEPGQAITLTGAIVNPIYTPLPRRLAARRLDGILISGGRAILMHAGQAHPLGAPYRLNMGVVVSPTGRLQMPDGTASQLGNGQLVTFDGTIRDPGGNPAGSSPIRSYPRNPRATTTGDSQSMITTETPHAAPLLGGGAAAR